jgi:hypothetical protein
MDWTEWLLYIVGVGIILAMLYMAYIIIPRIMP